jgi:hypothetical protein
MSENESLAERLERVEAERSEVRMLIAASHGEVPADKVAPTERPADERQAELSEESRKRRAAASKVYPAGESPAVIELDSVQPDGADDGSATEHERTERTSSTPTPAPAKPRASTGKE